MNRVFLLETQRFDLSWLYQHYQVKYIIPDKSQATALRDKPEELYELVRTWAVENFNPEYDTLALTGNLALLVMTAVALADTFPEWPIRLLKYELETNSYTEIKYDNANTAKGA